MLASLVALHLLVAAQAAEPPAPAGGDTAPPAEATPAPADAAAPPPAAPPADAPVTQPPPAPAPTPPPAAKPLPDRAPPAPPARPRFTSLLGAESLGGSSAAQAWAGWSSLGAAWAMGVTPADDLGAFADHDWAKSELRLGGLYRRALGSAGGFDVAFRGTVALYVNLGSTYVYSDNHSDRGVDLTPAVVFSQRAGGGLFAASVEGPFTITGKYKAGLLFSPRFGLSFEAPLYPQLTVGARAGAGYRAGAGDAPLREGRGELQFLVVAGYRLL